MRIESKYFHFETRQHKTGKIKLEAQLDAI